ncbi:pentatricopeptide repeat-containing protein At4g32450, mitochondrial-like [Zingiber officinale]|uniref:DYW domain-containing protein n=1 Tax=Zingiber officinale TaxID=94328 RepID=A0A8J5KCB4_ZINOF|nr:pentatricopeptide repeat-containing protein At4g32450, mitochondrial-like [Zingiber officinale]KAG6484020.1 hypothetical protein ZIOFF_060813 [Zingiber officinale]
MFKKKLSILTKSSLSLLSKVRSYSPPFPSYSLRLPSRNTGSLHDDFANEALPPSFSRWLNIAAERNDYTPEHCTRRESDDALNYHSNGIYENCSSSSRLETHQRSSLSDVQGGESHDAHTQVNANCADGRVTSNFYEGADRRDTSNSAHVCQMNFNGNEWRSNRDFSSDGYDQKNYTGTGGQSLSVSTSQHNNLQVGWNSQIRTGEFHHSSNFDRGRSAIANTESYGNRKEWHRSNKFDPSGRYGEKYPERLGEDAYSSFVNAKYGHNPGTLQHDPNSNCLDNRAGAFPNCQKGTYTDTEANIHQRSNGYYTAGYQREDPPVAYENSALSDNSVKQDVSVSSPNGSAEIGYSVTYKGTIEELNQFCKEKKMREAVEALVMLERNGFVVDLPRYLNLILACDDDKFKEEARKLHSHILQRFENVDVGVNNKFLSMYFKCSSTSDAYQLFDSMPHRNLTSWDTMIMGLANNGLGDDAIEMFTEFKQKGLTPDGGLFVSVFYVCGCLGAAEEGLLHFESMKKDFGIAPGMEHYLGIVDMLGRAGYLEEALEFIDQMPFEPSIDIWETLMTVSRLNGNLELGDLCAKVVEHLDASRLSEQSKKGLLLVKDSDLAKEKEKKKGLQLKSKIREYRAGDRSHPENDKLYAQLRCLQQQMKEAGYVPDTRFVLHDVDQESKEDALLAHSERLALSYALMTSSVRSDIRIMKNLRVCGDCHNALKIISKLVGRLIIARDAKRFHHFENGVCSCKDYW